MQINPHITKRLGAIPELNSNRWTAIIIWLVGAYLTSQALYQLGVAEPFNNAFGFAIQWALTKAESPLWKGQGAPKMAILATLIDGGINSAGAWPFMKNLGKTDFWTMIQDILQASEPPPQAAGAAPERIEPTTATIIVCSVGIGLMTAAAAEYFWNLR